MGLDIKMKTYVDGNKDVWLKSDKYFVACVFCGKDVKITNDFKNDFKIQDMSGFCECGAHFNVDEKRIQSCSR